MGNLSIGSENESFRKYQIQQSFNSDIKQIICRQSNSKYLLKEISTDTKEQCLRMIERIEQKIHHPNIYSLRIIQVHKQELYPLCGSVQHINIVMEFPQSTLHYELEHRKGSNSHFLESQLWKILSDVGNSIVFFQNRNYILSNLNLTDIYLSNGYYKIIDPELTANCEVYNKQFLVRKLGSILLEIGLMQRPKTLSSVSTQKLLKTYSQLFCSTLDKMINNYLTMQGVCKYSQMALNSSVENQKSTKFLNFNIDPNFCHQQQDCNSELNKTKKMFTNPIFNIVEEKRLKYHQQIRLRTGVKKNTSIDHEFGRTLRNIDINLPNEVKYRTPQHEDEIMTAKNSKIERISENNNNFCEKKVICIRKKYLASQHQLEEMSEINESDEINKQNVKRLSSLQSQFDDKERTQYNLKSSSPLSEYRNQDQVAESKLYEQKQEPLSQNIQNSSKNQDSKINQIPKISPNQQLEKQSQKQNQPIIGEVLERKFGHRRFQTEQSDNTLYGYINGNKTIIEVSQSEEWLSSPDYKRKVHLKAQFQHQKGKSSFSGSSQMSVKSQDKYQYVIQQYEGGSRYQGYKKDNVRSGPGKLCYQDGGMYDGQWKDNQMNGFGKLYYQNGKLAYEGYWKNGQFHGKGKIINDRPTLQSGGLNYRDLSEINEGWISYEGQFEEDAKSGAGILKLSNGQIIQGNWKNNNLDGQGIFYQLNNEIISAIWENNILVSYK